MIKSLRALFFGLSPCFVNPFRTNLRVRALYQYFSDLSGFFTRFYYDLINELPVLEAFMPVSTRGKKRDQNFIVPVTTAIAYGYSGRDLAALPGVAASDVTALGIITTGTVGTGVALIYGCNSPYPARFRKKLSGTDVTQQYCSSFGNGLTTAAINTASAAGWRLIKPIRTVGFGESAKSKNVAVQLSNGLYSVHSIPTQDASEANATLLGWDLTAGADKLAKCFRACSTMKPPKVSKVITNAVVTFPCKWSKVADAQAAGWKLVMGEIISSGGPGTGNTPE